MHVYLHMYECACTFVFMCWPEVDVRGLPQLLSILLLFFILVYSCVILIC